MIGVAALATAGAVLLMLRPTAAAPAHPDGAMVPGWLIPVAVVAATLLVGPLVAVVGGVALAGRHWWRTRRRRQEAITTADHLLEACELLAAEVSAGQPPDRALRRAADAWPVLAPAAEVATLGGDLPARLRRLGELPGAGELRLVGAAWEVAHRSGSGLADALDRVCASIRADRATRRVVESELASARATARLIAALPVLVLLLGTGAGGSTWAFLTGTPIGWACLVAGLGLGLLGLWWIERIAAGVVG